MRTESTLQDLEVISGAVPAEIEGTWYRAGPDRQYPPKDGSDVFIDGEGMVHMLRFENGLIRFVVPLAPGVSQELHWLLVVEQQVITLPHQLLLHQGKYQFLRRTTGGFAHVHVNINPPDFVISRGCFKQMQTVFRYG